MASALRCIDGDGDDEARASNDRASPLVLDADWVESRAGAGAWGEGTMRERRPTNQSAVRRIPSHTFVSTASGKIGLLGTCCVAPSRHRKQRVTLLLQLLLRRPGRLVSSARWSSMWKVTAFLRDVKHKWLASKWYCR